MTFRETSAQSEGTTLQGNPKVIVLINNYTLIGSSHLPTLERENNGDFTNDFFWLCMKFKTALSIPITDKKMHGKKRNLFYTDVFYLFTKTKYKYKMRTSATVDLK